MAGLAACFLFGIAQIAAAPAAHQQYCASCHGVDRLGGIGPVLLPESLSRLPKPEAEKVISEGQPATQMPFFAQVLGNGEIKALVDYA